MRKPTKVMPGGRVSWRTMPETLFPVMVRVRV